MAKSGRVRRQRLALGIVLVTIGAVLACGGALLASLGGSLYYMVAGLAVVGTGALALRGDPRASWLYAAMLGATFAWTLLESGWSPWQLQARLFAPMVLALWVFWPTRPASRLLMLAALAALGCGTALWLSSAAGVQAATPTAAAPVPALAEDGEWQHYGRDLAGSRFTPLTQINANSISRLRPAWTYHTGIETGRFEATPLMVNRTLYLCTSNNVVIALDPETGRPRWKFDPKVDAPPIAACRGVAYYARPGEGACTKRVIEATTDARLVAVDADTGARCHGFGALGEVDLRRGLGRVQPGYYYVSSAPAVIAGKVIVGGWIIDNQSSDEPSGVIRAFDAATGALVWAWDMDRPQQSATQFTPPLYSRASANSWAPISGDEALGLVYLPMGNATPDYWGGGRSAATEKYSSGVVALDIRTGSVVWSFQATHHDLWDYDVAGQPTLIDLSRKGQTIPAVVLSAKRGQIFLLDRRNGRPVGAVREVSAPGGAAPGDFVSPTQPRSSLPAFDGPRLSEAAMWGLTPLDQLWCRIKFRQARYDGPMTPPGVRQSLVFPGSFGGLNWGGVSVDPQRGLMTVNWNLMGNLVRLVPRAEANRMGVAEGGHLVIGKPMPQAGTPFAVSVDPFVSPLGVPCTQPPFGRIGVVDLRSGRLVWSRPLGTSADSGPLKIRSRVPLPMGVPNIGGSIMTASGLIFIAATQERVLRAFETGSGRELWRAPLPAGGNATPMSYLGPRTGKQFVVVAAGGHGPLQSGSSDTVIAFSLGKRDRR